MMRRIFGLKRDEVTGEWRKLHNEELNDLYCSQNNIPVIKPRRTRWAMHVARIGERTGAYRTLVGKSDGRDHLKDSRVDGRIILIRIFRKWDVGVWTGLIRLRSGTGGGHL